MIKWVKNCFAKNLLDERLENEYFDISTKQAEDDQQLLFPLLSNNIPVRTYACIIYISCFYLQLSLSSPDAVPIFLFTN